MIHRTMNFIVWTSNEPRMVRSSYYELQMVRTRNRMNSESPSNQAHTSGFRCEMHHRGHLPLANITRKFSCQIIMLRRWITERERGGKQTPIYPKWLQPIHAPIAEMKGPAFKNNWYLRKNQCLIWFLFSCGLFFLPALELRWGAFGIALRSWRTKNIGKVWAKLELVVYELCSLLLAGGFCQ